DSVAQVVDRLGPRTVGQLDDAERTAKLDAAIAASGWRELRAAEDDGLPLASGVEAAIVAEELARGLADSPFLGPTLAVELRRLAGRGAARGRLRPRAPAVRLADRLVPGRAASPGGRARRDRGIAERRAACGLGRRRTRAREGAGRGRVGQGVLRPRRPRGVR